VSDSLLDYYAAIERRSQQMLEAAEQEDWLRVAEMEGACSVLIDQLRQASQGQALSLEARREKARLMQSILRIDAQIRLLAEPMVDDIHAMLHAKAGQSPGYLH
jgi:flagellar protein FliT